MLAAAAVSCIQVNQTNDENLRERELFRLQLPSSWISAIIRANIEQLEWKYYYYLFLHSALEMEK